MIQDTFIPFGFQYYRSPTPFRDQWENDLRNIAEEGFNCVKYWVQWRSSVPGEGIYQFDDIQELMNIAHRNGLKVILNVIFDVAPAWFFRQYPDSKMITADGSVVEPRAINCRQIGGAPGPCYHHDIAVREKGKFLVEAVKAFKDHPALWVWDLWNEPELTTSIKRKLSFDNQVCYCENSMLAFQEWIKNKYGTLKAFNKAWQRTYGSWEEVEAPRGQGVFNDLVDWRLFMSDTLTEELQRRVDIVKSLDQLHPVMVHTVPAPIFNMITAGSDDFKLAEPCDLMGNSLGSSAWSADLLISAAKGKPIINSEIHALPGNTAMKPSKPDLREMKRHILIPLARGITGYLFWQYRPEILGQEAPAWGSVYLDGSPTPWYKDMAELNHLVQDNKKELLMAKRRSDGIAILFSPQNQIANFAAHDHLDTYNNSVQGVHKLLHELNYKVEFLHEMDISEESLAQYRCLWMPYPLYLNQSMCDTLRQWVNQGGILISECSFGALQGENGCHSYTVPGYGYDKVFGVRETWIHSVENLDHSYHQVAFESSTAIPLRNIMESGQGAEQLAGARTAHGSYYISDVELESHVKVLAEYSESGLPALTTATYGSGHAVYIGTLLAASYWQDSHPGTLQLVRDLLQGELNLLPQVNVSGGVRADLSQWEEEEGAGGLLFIHNGGERATTATIMLPATYTSAEPWFEDGSATLRKDSQRMDVTCLDTHIESGDVQVFRLS
ncbi:beta-galactosidase [Paenibacillus anaericanus]|uniref:beta-galactosidase n=1 Tax=Paenibacillus anaericanus TaxID=170367 RepID=UPI002781F7CE|nr:alpha-amylase family protein [Paenibacillus anaericanus]MDQ0091320.1 beta-galactosidase [Paenibacillus anaericanus]